MRSWSKFICIFVFSALTTAQSSPAKSPAAKAPEKSADKTEKPDAAANLPSEETVESFLQQTFGYEPSVSWKIASIKPTVGGLAEVTVILANPQGQQLSRFYVTSDGAHAVTGDIIPFGAKPFEPANKLLEKGMNGPERGPKNAPVTVVEFGDLQCPACKAAQPSIEQLYAAEPNVRFVFQNFPLEMHNWAAKGAAYADCVGRASNEAFWKFLAKDYETQADITAENADEKLGAIVESVGLKSADIAACAAKPETKARVEASLALGRSVEVTGTPTLYINGRKIGSFDAHMVDLYKGLIEFAAKETKDAAGTK
jgi:protein-disulfide isomerase